MKKQLLILCVALIATINLFASFTQVDGIWYDFDDTNLTASVTYRGVFYNDYSNEYTGSVVIPASVSYNSKTYSVTTIGNYAFCDCSGLTSVTIPNSVTTIGDYAFCHSGLTSVTIPNSVTAIGDYAFRNCSGLTSPIYNATIFAYMPTSYTGAYAIPDGIQQIAGGAFYGCTGLTSVTIPNSVTTIGNRAFYNCRGLISVNIPDSVTTIGESAFSGCNGLNSVTIPNSVTTIRESAFSGCNGLNSVTIPNSVTTIGNYAFYYCSGLKSITIPNSVITIGDYAFSGCSGLTSITSYVTTPPTCGSFCFYDVDKSISVYVPARSINAYKNASGWEDFTNLQANFNGVYVDVVDDSKMDAIEGTGYYLKGEICTLIVTPNYGYHFIQWNDGNTDNPRSFVVTQDSTFTAQIDTAKSGQCGDDLYWQLENDTLIITGSGAMYDYTEAQPAEWYLSNGKIAKLILPTGITHIGDSAFANLSNKNLKEIALPNSVETIGKYAFAECSYLKTITLGAKLEDIDEYVFQNDQRLLYVNCYAEEPPILQENAFDNYDIYLQVPCEVLDEYKVAKGWKLFNKENVSCLSAEEKPIEGDQVVVTPSVDNATFTWPSNPSADGYSLEITKDGVVFCTLKFNAQGQLTGIAFAPSRGGQAREMPAAEMTANGWQFTVTGLNQACKYGYTLDALNVSQQSIKHYEGEFATDGYVGLYTLPYEGKDGIGSTKFIHNNQLLIRHNGNLYHALGGKVR